MYICSCTHVPRQVPTYQNDFPDWDQEDWVMYVPPLIPSYLAFTVVLLAAVLIGTIVYVVRKRQAHSQQHAYVAIDTRERASSWL